ncbi:uncharacterized protein LOC129593203 [Paramacrobiotus metropolitanus]|uniref:uncharacterized protein LOC129593203 n=1 Tax=Paramacrobiotus metropolitanus TaxID=2943436 RepID=UPI00244587CA|nr:uncharacterized protein LOC129593203 [Paramacrobiotus metropolitanus]
MFSLYTIGLFIFCKLLGAAVALRCYECNFDPLHPTACWNVTAQQSVVCGNARETVCSVSAFHFRADKDDKDTEHLLITRGCGRNILSGAHTDTTKHYQDKRHNGVTCVAAKSEEATVECWCSTDDCNGATSLVLADGSVFGSRSAAATSAPAGVVTAKSTSASGALLSSGLLTGLAVLLAA